MDNMKPVFGLIPESSDSLKADSIFVKSEVQNGKDVRHEKAKVFIVGESMFLKNFGALCVNLKILVLKKLA